jgi:GTP-binding protein Era
VTAAPRRTGFIALAGRSNVGKSTLVNRLVGEKVAIVSSVPQTTRNRILGVRTDPDAQYVFVDTPGFHKPRYRLNRAMVQTATAALSGVDVILLVADAAAGLGPGDHWAARVVQERAGSRPVVVALTKIDLIPRVRSLPLIEAVVDAWSFDEVVPLSGLTGENCDELLTTLRRWLPEGTLLFPEDYLTDQPERALAAELVREKLFEATRQEVPHALAVRVTGWIERQDGLVEIEADVLVEREGQKGIVIGRGGRVLKEVGTAARLELEQRFGTRVGLRLLVRVREGWRDRASLLRDLGLDHPDS